MTSTHSTFQAYEATGTLDENGVLEVAPFVGATAGRVRVTVLVAPLLPVETQDENYSLEEMDEKTWHHGIVSNPVFDFLKDPAEDIYTAEDGEPLPPLRPETRA